MRICELKFARGLVAAAALGLLVSGCAPETRVHFTEAEAKAAVPYGMPANVRFWADSPLSSLRSSARPPITGKPFVYLALSGGGGGGAYGAGVLNGWTPAGNRPEFTVVSGVSTGALIAPFAFLGPSYDATLNEIYTSGEAEELLRDPDPLGVFFGAGLYGRSRLRRMVERYVDDSLLRAIADEDAKGRRLLVVTTDLDSQRAAIWDMGAIASSHAPNAYKLFRDVIAASASVPVVFSPQLINVAADGQSFQEMHADGTVSKPIFTLPDVFLFGAKSPIAGRTRPALYMIVNSHIDPTFEETPPQAQAIAMRSFATMNRANTIAVLAQTYSA
jgi:predicted acylesterase/phospholipase RssA